MGPIQQYFEDLMSLGLTRRWPFVAEGYAVLESWQGEMCRVLDSL